MKRGTPDHPKMEMLADMLGVCVAQAVGHIEMLLHFVAKHSPRGDVGRWPDAMIAKRSGWTKKPEKFIEALVEAKGTGRFGWLERHPDHRLVVHDWHEHAEESVKKWLSNHGETFWTGAKPFAKKSRKDNDLDDSDEADIREPVAITSRTCRDDVATNARLPSLAMPSLANIREEGGIADVPVATLVFSGGKPDNGDWIPDFTEVWRKRYGGRPKHDDLLTHLSGPRSEVGHGELLQRWRNYCHEIAYRYGPSAERFAGGHGEFSDERSAARKEKHGGRTGNDGNGDRPGGGKRTPASSTQGGDKYASSRELNARRNRDGDPSGTGGNPILATGT